MSNHWRSGKAEITQENNKLLLKFQIPNGAEKIDLKNGERSSKFLAYQARESAEEYYNITKRYYKSNLQSPKLEVFISLCGLACEIYLKSLLYYLQESNSFTVGHKLSSDLYSQLTEMLPPEKKNIIKDRVCRDFIETCFEEELKKLDTIFVDFRYSYELIGYSINLKFLVNFMDTLHDITFDHINSSKDTVI